MERLFIGLPIEKSIVDKLKNPLEKLKNQTGKIKTVPPENLHITIKFLGDTDEETKISLIKRLPEALSGFSAIPYQARGFGAFPSLKKPTIFWCGLRTDLDILTSLQKIEMLSKELGFPAEEKKFRPHITLGRIRRDKKISPEIIDYLAKNRDMEFGSAFFDKVILFKSDLTSAGPRYSELITCRLKHNTTGK